MKWQSSIIILQRVLHWHTKKPNGLYRTLETTNIENKHRLYIEFHEHT